MIKNIKFEDEVSEWLLSIGFNCRMGRVLVDGFTSISVYKNEKLFLELILVDLETFSSTSKELAYLKLGTRQQQIRDAGIHCVILWEDVWLHLPEIVKSRISSILTRSVRIPARLTKEARIDKATANLFLNKNHLQGAVQSKYQFGLYLPVRYFRILPADYQSDNRDGDLLVAVATFSHVRVFKKEDEPFRSYEMIRFASLINTTVVGGLDKILSAFVKEIKPDDIMTYADLEWSNGNGYKKLGFEEISEKSAVSFSLNIETNERLPLRNSISGENMIEICNAGSTKFVKIIKNKTV